MATDQGDVDVSNPPCSLEPFSTAVSEMKKCSGIRLLIPVVE
jgi:hypothetical protein